MPGPHPQDGEWSDRVRRPRPRRRPAPKPKAESTRGASPRDGPAEAPATPARRPAPKPKPEPRRSAVGQAGGTAREAPITPTRRRGGARAGRPGGNFPGRDPEGDFQCPPGGDINEPGVRHLYSPLLRHIRERKRGADKLEECLTRGIRKARGQWVTPRKRRNRGQGRPLSPAPDLVLDAEPPGGGRQRRGGLAQQCGRRLGPHPAPARRPGSRPCGNCQEQEGPGCEQRRPPRERGGIGIPRGRGRSARPDGTHRTRPWAGRGPERGPA